MKLLARHTRTASVLHMIEDRTWLGPGVGATVRMISNTLDLPRSTTRRYVHRLIEDGFIEPGNVHRRSRLYVARRKESA